MVTGRRVDDEAMTRRNRPGAHPVFAAAVLVLVPTHLLTAGLARDLVSAAAAVLPIIVLGVLLARRRLAGPGPWRFLLAGLVVLLVYTVAWMIDVHGRGVVPAGPVIAFAPPVGYLLFLAAAAILVYQPQNRPQGATIDAAIFALSASLLFWALLLGPYLERLALPTATRMRTMAAVVVLGATAGALAGPARTAGTRNRTLMYLLVAAVSTVAGTVARELTVSPEHVGGAWWVGALWIVGYCALTAAALDPAARALSPEIRPDTNRITPITLVGLGAALCVGPVIALTQEAAGVPVDGLLVGGSSLAILPLVLVRIAQLARLRALAEQQLAHLAEHDELTGLANRRRLFSHLAAALNRLAQGEMAGVIVLFCDLDGFKEINDDHGHQVGDEVLLVVAQRLRAAVRAQDMVARFGGDEFVVVVEGDPTTAEQETVARIVRALTEPVCLGTVLTPTGASIGAASAVRGRTVTPDQLISAADATMYAQKRARSAERADAGQR